MSPKVAIVTAWSNLSASKVSNFRPFFSQTIKFHLPVSGFRFHEELIGFPQLLILAQSKIRGLKLAEKGGLLVSGGG